MREMIILMAVAALAVLMLSGVVYIHVAANKVGKLLRQATRVDHLFGASFDKTARDFIDLALFEYITGNDNVYAFPSFDKLWELPCFDIFRWKNGDETFVRKFKSGLRDEYARFTSVNRFYYEQFPERPAGMSYEYRADGGVDVRPVSKEFCDVVYNSKNESAYCKGIGYVVKR